MTVPAVWSIASVVQPSWRLLCVQFTLVVQPSQRFACTHFAVNIVQPLDYLHSSSPIHCLSCATYITIQKEEIDDFKISILWAAWSIASVVHPSLRFSWNHWTIFKCPLRAAPSIASSVHSNSSPRWSSLHCDFHAEFWRFQKCPFSAAKSIAKLCSLLYNCHGAIWLFLNVHRMPLDP